MTSATQKLVDEMVRDFTAVGSRPKSEVRRRILEAISAVEAEAAPGESIYSGLCTDLRICLENRNRTLAAIRALVEKGCRRWILRRKNASMENASFRSANLRIDFRRKN